MSRGRALVIAPWLPESDRESGLRRLSDLIDMLLDRGWEVTFGCLHPRSDKERYVHELELRGVETHAPLESLDSIRDPDRFGLAILAFWQVAERFLPELRRVSPSTRVIVDSVDLHFLREMREKLRPAAGPPGQIAASQATELSKEINCYAAADAVLTVSEKEAALINDFTGRDDLAYSVPDAEDLPRSPVPLRDRRGILFLANFVHAPNRDAASYLCEEIVPLLDPSLLAEHEISIVGTAAEEHMPELTDGLVHVKTVGWVPSVLPYLNAARISIVPLRYGAGTKRKVIQALMAGTPTVMTSVGAEGLGLRDGREAVIADDPYAFAAGVERLVRRSLTWRRLARRGRSHVQRLHGRAIVESRFDHVLDIVLERVARPAVERPEGGSRPVRDDVARVPEYARLVARVRDAIESELPEDAKVLVATRGDEGFLSLEGRLGWHFPREDDGRYAGYHPADSESAIAHLEELREQGATHLALPRTAFWWLAFYEDLHRYLAATYRLVRSDEDVIAYDLTAAESAPAPAASGAAPLERITPELIHRLQPTTLEAASRYRDGAGRALVLGVYLAGKPNTAEHVAATLARSRDFEVRQVWAALGEDHPDAPASSAIEPVTALKVTEPTPKYALLNRLLAGEDLTSYDYVLTTDDDVVLPEGFLDLFLGVQAGLGFDLAQPARTLNSHVDHPIVAQQRGVVARRTQFVEIGPVVSFGREILDLVLPFDETNPMGWGFDSVWAHLLRERGRSEGIIDAVPVDHSIRKPVAHYKWADADADRDRYLAQHPHLSLEECFQVLEVIGVES